ncbi:hypothetical protein I546_1588 [Mycobacterium kansasii 732]|uniref:Uncharacterized protein n=1 Tax=Mycobacterium pseudokansasii TaxID=2341080 RepID=A0A498QVV5_9MYCO|nr:hypothetical protein [Mycobacterium pseudokansasii]EUA13097.1 hypothetical protein I546_1588 [Mycobacterium kansasii 732]KZS66388.1 hypothetical protein A4G27_04600 [Mycobacterium kansasii]MBY0389733.1 hypothetical protein [Mycobacterium pseudokansasii]VAZ97918.1 hypothetical protein LAUMK35_03841 [Mycobacterium pseudokansasii]VAZ99412.1 hypothetical protein LAUMK21_03837 [Mycobacterium pseudokansasii]
MPSLQQRLASILRDVLSVEQEPDGALTVRHNGTFASLRVVSIAEGLELVSLTQILAWDLPLTRKIRDRAAKQARDVNFGAVTVLEKGPGNGTAKGAAKTASKTGDVMLRYNFPGAGLGDDALRTLILLVLDSGARIRDALIAGAP